MKSAKELAVVMAANAVPVSKAAGPQASKVAAALAGQDDPPAQAAPKAKPAPAKPKAKPKSAAPAPAPAEREPMPWENEDPRILKPMTFRPDAVLSAKLEFICDNTPRTTKHGFIMAAALAAADARIAEILAGKKEPAH